MLDPDTFLTILYVTVDDFCKAELAPERHPGPAPGLSRSELLTLALFGQWQGFGSERGFYRHARRHLRAAFPGLPTREQFNRQLRRQYDALVACALSLLRPLGAEQAPFEALDTTAVPTRERKRRGRGWLPGVSAIGWSPRLGWFAGCRLLLAVSPLGAITGFALAPGNAKEQPLTDSFLARRRHPDPRARSVGAPARGPYLADQGFVGRAWQAHWRQDFGAVLLCPPQPPSPPWPKPWRRWANVAYRAAPNATLPATANIAPAAVALLISLLFPPEKIWGSMRAPKQGTAIRPARTPSAPPSAPALKLLQPGRWARL